MTKTLSILLLIMTAMTLTAKAQTVCAKTPIAEDGIIRYSVIEIIPEYLEEYMPFSLEVGETSMKTEPGVLAMYPTVSKEDSLLFDDSAMFYGSKMVGSVAFGYPIK